MRKGKYDEKLDQLAMSIEYGKELSRTEIAEYCGCEADYIRKIEKAGIAKLIDYCRFHPIKDYLI